MPVGRRALKPPAAPVPSPADATVDCGFDLLDFGVWAPTRCVREASAAGSSEADQSDSLVGGFARCAATLSELGLPGMRMDILLEMIASLPFEASMTYLGPLAAGLHQARHETRLHLRLAEQVFGQGPMLDVIRRFVVAGPDRVVFDERYLTVLQRLLVEHAQAARACQSLRVSEPSS